MRLLKVQEHVANLRQWCFIRNKIELLLIALLSVGTSEKDGPKEEINS